MPGTFPSAVIAAAIASHTRYRIPASVTLAQWAVESAWGAHMSGKNNPFGIKAKPPAPCTSCMTREVIHGQVVHLPQFFADYPDMTGAFDAHAHLLASYPAYAKARAKLPDAEAFAHALTGVYATDPHYGDTLVGVMRAHGLAEYDAPHPPTSPPIVRLAPELPRVSAPAHVLPAPAKPSLLNRLKARFGWLALACAVLLAVGPALAADAAPNPSPNAALWAWVGANVVPLLDQALLAIIAAAISAVSVRAVRYFGFRMTAGQEEAVRQTLLTGAHAAIAAGESAADNAQLVERATAWAKEREGTTIARLGWSDQVLAKVAVKMVAGAVSAALQPAARG